jgi:hypothetical protein
MTRVHLYYILDERGEPVAAGPMTWARWYETADRRVAFDDLGERGQVSTVFLGVDHAFRDDRPVLWESMVFGGPHDQQQFRYHSRAEALAGHAVLVEAIMTDS